MTPAARKLAAQQRHVTTRDKQQARKHDDFRDRFWDPGRFYLFPNSRVVEPTRRAEPQTAEMRASRGARRKKRLALIATRGRR